MKVALFGATGIVGDAVLTRLLECGYEVSVLTRRPWKITRRSPLLNVVAGHVTASMDGKGLKFSITAGDLARFIVEMLTDRTYLHKAPTVSN